MPSSSKVAAINLGMQSVTMAVFEASGTSLTLSRFARTELLADPASDASRFGQLGIALSELRTKLQWNGGDVACAIPSQGLFARFVKIPKVDPEKVEQMLYFEAQQNVPYPIEDVSWAYQIIPDSEPDSLSALILATKLVDLEAAVETMSSAGLAPSHIDTSPVALYNAFRFNYPEVDGCTLLIDVGSRSTNLLFIEGEKLFLRTLPIGGSTITSAIQKRFEGRSFAEIEEIKRADAFIPPPGNYSGAKSAEAAEIGKIARTVMTRIHNEITRSITFYRTNQHGSAPMRIFLAGGGTTLPYTLEFFNEKLSLPIEFFNPFRRISVGSQVDQSELLPIAHCLGECTGAALHAIIGNCPIDVSLKSPTLEQKQVELRRRPFLIGAAALLVSSVALVGLYYHNAAQHLAAINDKIESESAPLTALKAKIDKLNAERKGIIAEGADLAAAPVLRSAWASIINELNIKLPQRNIWITRLRPQVGETALEPDPSKPGWGFYTEGNTSSSIDKKNETKEQAVTAIVIDGLYLENEGGPAVVDKFVDALAESPVFAITNENRESVIQMRATQSGATWAYEYKLVLPLVRSIPL